jgi:hypothetical protein
MNLYVWQYDTSWDYDLFCVLADSVEQARELVMADLRENYPNTPLHYFARINEVEPTIHDPGDDQPVVYMMWGNYHG